MVKAAKKAAKAAKPKAPKGPKKPRGATAAPQASGSVAGDNVVKMDPKMRELARHHRDKYIIAKTALSKAQRGMQALGKTIKADGLTVKQIKVMVDLMTPEGEAAFRASMIGDLQAAQWQGASIGTQLSLFMEPDRTPSGDIAFDEGVQDAMDHKIQSPKYAPSVPQYKRYLEGYAQEQERQIKEGIKPDVKPNPIRAETLAAARAKNAEESPPAETLN